MLMFISIVVVSYVITYFILRKLYSLNNHTVTEIWVLCLIPAINMIISLVMLIEHSIKEYNFDFLFGTKHKTPSYSKHTTDIDMISDFDLLKNYLLLGVDINKLHITRKDKFMWSFKENKISYGVFDWFTSTDVARSFSVYTHETISDDLLKAMLAAENIVIMPDNYKFKFVIINK